MMTQKQRRGSSARWIAALPCAALGLAAPDAHALAVYHIGNSLVLQNEQRVVIKALALQAGHMHSYSMSVILGAPLSYIWSNPGASGGWEGQVYPSGLAPSRAWDALVLEPYDRDFHFYPYDNPGADGYGENDVLNSDNFYKLALAGNPKTQLYIYEIFPTQSGWATIPEQRTLAHAMTIAEQVNKLHASAAPVMIIPAGDVIQKLGALADQGQLPHIADHTALYGDEDHLNEVGSYAVALTHLACLYREDPHVYSNKPVYPEGSDWPTGSVIWRDIPDYKLLGPLGGAVWPETAAVIKDVVDQVTANTPRSGRDGGVRITTAALAPAVVGQSYTAKLVGSLGQAPYRWSISTGTLPAGLSLNGDTVAGTPTAAGNSAFSVQMTDSSTPAKSVVQSFTLSVAAVDVPFTVDATTLPVVARGTHFAQALHATGGVGPLSFAVDSGALPSGVTLASDGMLQGSPGQEGAFTFSVIATDSAPGTARSARRTFALTVTALGAATLVADLRACSAGAPAIDSWSFTSAATKVVGTTDNQVRFAASWDAQNLYVGIDVRDANVVATAGSVATQGDAVEIFVNADNGKGTLYGARDRRIVVGPNGDRWLPDGRDTGIVTHAVTRPGGYSVSLTVPWANLGTVPNRDVTVGFDVANRDDDGAGRAGSLFWFGSDDDANRPSAWGNLLLGPMLADAGGGGACTADAGAVESGVREAVAPSSPSDGGPTTSSTVPLSAVDAGPAVDGAAGATSQDAGMPTASSGSSASCSSSNGRPRSAQSAWLGLTLLAGAACVRGRRRGGPSPALR